MCAVIGLNNQYIQIPSYTCTYIREFTSLIILKLFLFHPTWQSQKEDCVFNSFEHSLNYTEPISTCHRLNIFMKYSIWLPFIRISNEMGVKLKSFKIPFPKYYTCGNKVWCCSTISIQESRVLVFTLDLFILSLLPKNRNRVQCRTHLGARSNWPGLDTECPPSWSPTATKSGYPARGEDLSGNSWRTDRVGSSHTTWRITIA